MIYPHCVQQATLYEGLARIDQELAAGTRARGCPHCHGPLDAASWTRKPRGFELPETLCVRHGLCCRNCRRRVLPPSALFLGRKVYLAAVVLVSIVSRQRQLDSSSARALRNLFGIARQTLARWLSFFGCLLPASAPWKVLRARLSAAVRDDQLPNSFLTELERTHPPGNGAITAALQLLATTALQAF
jgi:hypothetical protein